MTFIYGEYIFTIHESVLSVSCYYIVAEVILKIDATKSLSSFPLCLTDDPLVLSKTVRKAILTIPFSKYIQGWFCRWLLITNNIQILVLLLIKYNNFTSEQTSSSFKKTVHDIECHLLIYSCKKVNCCCVLGKVFFHSLFYRISVVDRWHF